MRREKTWYLQCKRKLPEIGILVGDPARVDIFAANMEQVTKVSSYHGFKMIIGQFKNIPMTVLSFGMGGPAAAVAIEELAGLGTKIVVRAGTSMALNCSLGDLIVAEGAVRLDGTSPWYLPLAFPAIPDAELLTAFIKYLEQEKINYVSGIIVSIDALHPKRFAQLGKENINLSQYIDVKGVDMETAITFVASRALGLKSLSICLASVKFGNFEKLSDKERKNGEQKLVSVVLQGMFQYIK